MKFLIVFFLFIGKCSSLFSQTISMLHSETHGPSFRGLSVVNDDVLWVSGSKGTVGKSIDGGKTWKFIVVKGVKRST